MRTRFEAPDPGAALDAGSGRWRRVDEVLAAVLLFVLGAVALAMLNLGAMVALPADVCGGDGVRCDFARIDAAAVAARFVPAVLLVGAVVGTVVRVRRRRTAFFLPLIGLAGAVATFFVAFGVVDAAITG